MVAGKNPALAPAIQGLRKGMGPTPTSGAAEKSRVSLAPPRVTTNTSQAVEEFYRQNSPLAKILG